MLKLERKWVAQNALLSLTCLFCFVNMACHKKDSSNVLGLPSQSIQRGNVHVQSVVTTLPECPNLKPPCAGGLLDQHVSPSIINLYLKRDANAAAGNCRYMQPPRCYTHQKRVCKEECTP
jgi:hypothetical protein